MTPAFMAAVGLIAVAQLSELPPSLPPEVPYVSTPLDVVDVMLRVAEVGPGDVLYDLGCGDGRIVLRAALERGARGVGVDVDARLVAAAQEAAIRAGAADRVTFRQEDFFGTDLRDATVVTLYLSPLVDVQLRARLVTQLRPGARIVSHQFGMGSWKPDRVTMVRGHPVLLWRVPSDPARRRAIAEAAE